MNSPRAIVNVATGPWYIEGQRRLAKSMEKWAPDAEFIHWTDRMPEGSPSHEETPYGFKAYEFEYARDHGFDQILHADASIVAIAPIERIWDIAAKNGAWIGRNGWRNSEWTSDEAYGLLFPEVGYREAREINKTIEHVVATTFALDLRHPIGKEILERYARLARAGAFKGPWTNGPAESSRKYPCGPPDCLGHRHDQTVLSVLAWRLCVELSSSPDIFAYAGGETDKTILVADGGHALEVPA